ncbi:hypothetical protein [Streptomyces virginiae]|uniref:hypothetical protein n=1 Tax=Streptomyces virginiae TaxID=1961 RepID=UPI003653B3E7
MPGTRDGSPATTPCGATADASGPAHPPPHLTTRTREGSTSRVGVGASHRPRLVDGRGALSEGVTRALRSGGPPAHATAAVRNADPFGEGLQLALHLLYELHHRSFDGVDDAREWDPDLLRLRGAMEDHLLPVLRCELSDAPRSVEAAMVAIEYDEFGAGRAGRVATRLFADLMADLGLYRELRGSSSATSRAWRSRPRTPHPRELGPRPQRTAHPVAAAGVTALREEPARGRRQ